MKFEWQTLDRTKKSGEANLTEGDKSINGIFTAKLRAAKNKIMENSIKILIKFSFAFIFLPCLSASGANAQIISNQDRPKIEDSSNKDLSTDEAVREELAKISGGKLNLVNFCIERLMNSVIVIGNRANDKDCRIDGVFVDSRYFKETDPALPKTGLAVLGWAKANRQEREKLATLWIEKVLFAFSAKPNQIFQAVSVGDGRIKVIVSLKFPPGVTSRNAPRIFIFDIDGGFFVY